ncbi:ATP synthase F0 subunit C [Clostridium sediminicola]|uniref:ATP synthase F0 subunit C n=1 Tax=Clostridium sediminicola TaxID=3114879 RepID=UPI0031F1F136
MSIAVGLLAIGAGMAALSCIGGGIGTGNATSKAVESIARQPEAANDIIKALVIGGALSEATAIYGFLIGILLVLKIAV